MLRPYAQHGPLGTCHSQVGDKPRALGEDLGVREWLGREGVARPAFPGSVNIPLGEVADRMGELDASRPTAVICAGGVRSAKAVTALTAAGYTGELLNVSGGMKAWLGQ